MTNWYEMTHSLSALVGLMVLATMTVMVVIVLVLVLMEVRWSLAARLVNVVMVISSIT